MARVAGCTQQQRVPAAEHRSQNARFFLLDFWQPLQLHHQGFLERG